MATAEGVKSKIQNLINNANQLTGARDTTLTAAVTRLLAGYGGGGTVVNGTPRRYTVEAGANVTAGDFVEFIEQWGSGKISSTKSGALSAVALSDSRALVAYGGTSDGYGRAVVLSVDGATVTVGTPYIFNSAKTDEFISAEALNDDKVLIAYRNGGNNNYGAATILSVDGLTISQGIMSNFYSGTTSDISTAYLGSNKVFVAYRGTDNSGRAQVLHFNATTNQILTGSTITFETSIKEPTAAALSATKVLVMYQTYDWGSNKPIYGMTMAMSVNESTMALTQGAAHTFRNAPVAYLALTALSDTRALGIFQNTSSSKQLVAILFNVIDRTVTSGGSIVLNTTAAGSYPAITRISTNKVLVAADFYSTQHEAKAMVLTVNDWNISTWPAATFLTDVSADAISLSNLLAFSESTILLVSNEGTGRGTTYRGITVNGNTTTVAATGAAGGTSVRPATSNKYNVGVAKTSGTAGATVEVYRVK